MAFLLLHNYTDFIIFNVNYFNKINKKGKKYATRISINESYEKKHGFN